VKPEAVAVEGRSPHACLIGFVPQDELLALRQTVSEASAPSTSSSEQPNSRIVQ
jgi:hypothetical protein